MTFGVESQVKENNVVEMEWRKVMEEVRHLKHNIVAKLHAEIRFGFKEFEYTNRNFNAVPFISKLSVETILFCSITRGYWGCYLQLLLCSLEYSHTLYLSPCSVSTSTVPSACLTPTTGLFNLTLSFILSARRSLICPEPPINFLSWEKKH